MASEIKPESIQEPSSHEAAKIDIKSSLSSTEISSDKETLPTAEQPEVGHSAVWFHPVAECKVETLNSDAPMNIKCTWCDTHKNTPVLWNGDVFMVGSTDPRGDTQCKLLKYLTSNNSWSEYVLPCDYKGHWGNEHTLTTYGSKLLLINGLSKKVWEFDADESTFKPSPDITLPWSWRACRIITASSEGEYLVIIGKAGSSAYVNVFDGNTWVVCDAKYRCLCHESEVQVIIHNHFVYLTERLPTSCTCHIFHEMHDRIHVHVVHTSLQSLINNERAPWQLLESIPPMCSETYSISNFVTLWRYLSFVSFSDKEFGVWHCLVNSESWLKTGSTRILSQSFNMQALRVVRLSDETLMVICYGGYGRPEIDVYRLKPKDSLLGELEFSPSPLSLGKYEPLKSGSPKKLSTVVQSKTKTRFKEKAGNVIWMSKLQKRTSEHPFYRSSPVHLLHWHFSEPSKSGPPKKQSTELEVSQSKTLRRFEEEAGNVTQMLEKSASEPDLLYKSSLLPLHVPSKSDTSSFKPLQQSKSEEILSGKNMDTSSFKPLQQSKSEEILSGKNMDTSSFKPLRQSKSEEILSGKNMEYRQVNHKAESLSSTIFICFVLSIIMAFTVTCFTRGLSQEVVPPHNPTDEDSDNLSVHQSTLPGIEFIYLKTHTIVQNPITQSIALRKFGIQLHIPPNTFSEPVLKITVGVSLSGSVVVPVNMSLVSAIYYIKVSSKLLQPITVELEHCVTILDNNSISGLKFGKAKTESYWSSLPYHFEVLSEGNFTVGKSWSTIKMLEFCLLGIFWCNDVPPNIAYLGGVLSDQLKFRKLGSHKILFLTGHNLAVNKEIILKEYSEWTQIIQWFSFKFVNGSDKLTLHISENGDVSGHWKIRAIVSPPEIGKSEIDFHNVVLCEMRASWMNEDEGEGEFEHTVSMSGIDKNSVTIIIDKLMKDQDYCDAMRESSYHDHKIREFRELYQAVAKIGNWRGLCMNLNVDTGTIDSIGRSIEAVDTKKEMCLKSFFNSGSATWEAVIKAVTEYPVNNKRVADKIAKKQQINTVG